MRKWLVKDSILHFPGMTCKVKANVGRGSNALVYLGEYEDQLSPGQFHEVLIKELFPLHPQGAIYRNPKGHICIAPEGEALYQLHRNSFERGNNIHLELLKKNPSMVGSNINTFLENGTLYTLMGCSGSLPFDIAMREEGLTLRKITKRMCYILDALQVFHESELLHLDVSPDNILVIPQAQREHVILIDYNSSATYSELQNGSTEYCSIKHGYTAPEICNGDYARIGFHSDLYSVASIFYTCLVGRTLTLEETIRSTPPDGMESKYLIDAPETVRYMVKRILRRGLNTLTSRRYANISAMRNDLHELLDRIDGVGVTHGALYESSQKALNEFVRGNISFAFLKNPDELYPLTFYDGSANAQMNNEDFLRECLEANTSILLGANGGQGKTTALLYMALQQNASYSPQKTVAFFLPAYGYRPDDMWFIHDSILRMLRFKKETGTYAVARHELDNLLSQTLSGGRKPMVLILLDGMNEVACDASLLIQELNELARMPGVALVISSRSEIQGLQVKRITLEPLSPNEVSDALVQYGLLLPEDVRMHQLLRTPLMLSMFIRTLRASQQQLTIASTNELISLMLMMEVNRYAQDDSVHWQMDVAIYYVLPAIANSELGGNRSLSESELLKVVTRCYKTIRARDMLRFYPRWIGHSKEILGDAKVSEEWFAIVVQELLWRRAGLLVKGEDGGYRIYHQQVSEWLLGLHRENHRRILKRKAVRASTATMIVLLLGIAFWNLAWVPYIGPLIEETDVIYYPESEAQEIVQSAMERCYSGSNAMIVAEKYLEWAEKQEELNLTEYFDRYLPQDLIVLRAFSGVSATTSGLEKYEQFEKMENDPRMPWSENDFAYKRYCELASLPTDMATQYTELLSVLDWLMHNEKWHSIYYEEFIAQFDALMQVDKALLDAYYTVLVKPELEGLNRENSSLLYDLTKLYPYKAENLFEAPDFTLLLNQRSSALRAIREGQAMDRYKTEYDK